jgi:hypothetical protein
MNRPTRTDVAFLSYCLANKLSGEAMVYLYYRNFASETGGVTKRSDSVCGLSYRQQLRYLKSLEKLGWVQFLPKNQIKLKSIRALRPELGITSRLVVEIENTAFSSLREFKAYCFSIATESVARVQNLVVKKGSKSRDICGSETAVFPSRTKKYTAAEVLRGGIGHYKNQMSLSLLSENLSMPKSTAADLKRIAKESGMFGVKNQVVILKSKEDAIALKEHGYHPRFADGNYFIFVADEFVFNPKPIGSRSFGKRRRNDYKPKQDCVANATREGHGLTWVSSLQNGSSYIEPNLDLEPTVISSSNVELINKLSKMFPYRIFIVREMSE